MGGGISAVGTRGLPADTTSFVGRKNDVAEIRRLLSEVRLVTLTGVGGVGKTRLATRVATVMARTFPDGVAVVTLEHVRDPTLVACTVVEALGIRNETDRRPQAVLEDYLRDRELLLVLDNCAHVIDACADLVAALLRASPGLKVLATSRQRLRLPGEHVRLVAPLSLPDLARPLPPGAALQYPALTLFAERATAAEPAFVVTADNQALVAEVCHLVDGIPLAIELVATRLRVLSLEHLTSRLADSYWSLVGGRRGGARGRAARGSPRRPPGG